MSDLPLNIASPILHGLNEQQKEAVLHGTGPLLIFAGAGSVSLPSSMRARVIVVIVASV